MALTVLDSSNLDAIVKDATGEGLKPPPLPAGDDANGKGPKADPVVAAQADDVPGEDGLTPQEKRELSGKMQKAIAKRVRQVREAEEFAAEEFRGRRLAEQRAEQAEAELQRLAKQAPKQQNEQPLTQIKQKPERKNFANDDEYITAVTNFAVDEAMAKRSAEEAKARFESEQREVLAAASARIAKAIELVPDFEEVTSAADYQIPDHVAGYMQTSEMFAELGYFLAKNPEVVTALHKMTPARQLVEIGKIEGKLPPFAPAATDAKGSKNGATPGTKQGTDGEPAKPAPRSAAGEIADPSAARRAAPVITPISTNGSGSVEMDLENGNVRDHIAEFARKRGANLLRRQRH